MLLIIKQVSSATWRGDEVVVSVTFKTFPSRNASPFLFLNHVLLSVLLLYAVRVERKYA